MKRTASLCLALALTGAVFASACGDGPDDPATPQATPTTEAPVGTPIVLENATETASGLKYVDDVVGTGDTPVAASIVTVHYTGRLAANGFKFDSSVDLGQPATFEMGRVIAGFAEALSTMKVGGKRTAYIPAALGYREEGFPPDIPPDADLVFEIELISIQ